MIGYVLKDRVAIITGRTQAGWEIKVSGGHAL